jgi:hypothetical protein
VDQAKKIKALEKKIKSSGVMDRIKPGTGVPTLVLLMFICYLAFVGVQFTKEQALLLTIVGFFALDAHRRANTPPSEFRPFFIHIQPDWHLLAKDFALTSEDNVDKAIATTWEGTKATLEHGAPPSYSVLRDGIGFTVLSHTLMYSRDHKFFFSGNSIREDIAEFTAEKNPRRYGGPYPPQFHVNLKADKNKITVFEFGLRTEESISKANERDRESANINLVQLPYVIFRDFYDFKPGLDHDAEEKALLKEYGWVQKERNLRDPYTISHKYLQVSYGQI